MIEYEWIGSKETFIDEVKVQQLDDNLVVGCFGGNSSVGQYKNEDGCLVWINQEHKWELAMILDAHHSSQSAELVLNTVANQKYVWNKLLQKDIRSAFSKIQQSLLDMFTSMEFYEKCQHIQGETACLIAIRKENYLWWFSVGDCLLYLYHPDLSELGEYQQNHRSFYEWIGKNSTFNKQVPCYSSGVKGLREGKNHIFLTTDGLVECPDTDFFTKTESIFIKFDDVSHHDGVRNLLEIIKEKQVRDSTTIISWIVMNRKSSILSSDT